VRVSTKTRYAARAMVDLAMHQVEEPISVREIGVRQGVSRKYLEQLFAALQSAGLVRAVRGRRGGHVLGRPPEEITVRDIYEVAEGGEDMVPCGEQEACERAEECVMREVWAQMQAAMLGALGSVTLADLAERARLHAAHDGDMYCI